MGSNLGWGTKVPHAMRATATKTGCSQINIFKKKRGKKENSSGASGVPGGGALVTRLCPALVIPWTVVYQALLPTERKTVEQVTISSSRGSS